MYYRMWRSYRQGAKQEEDSGSCKCDIDADGARNGQGATVFNTLLEFMSTTATCCDIWAAV
jgi:hypothetical protein